MRNLCFGGSFNPIHNGHLICGRAVAAALNGSQLVLIPSATSPHKLRQADIAAAGDRLAMCRLAAAGVKGVEVDDAEIRRGPPSYTIDTIRQLHHERGWNKVSWLIGADQLAALPRWREAATLLREVNFVVMARPAWSFDWNSLPLEFQTLQSHVVEAPLLDISATDIRRRVREGKSIDALVPPAVAQYIQSRGLYRS